MRRLLAQAVSDHGYSVRCIAPRTGLPLHLKHLDLRLQLLDAGLQLLHLPRLCLGRLLCELLVDRRDLELVEHVSLVAFELFVFHTEVADVLAVVCELLSELGEAGWRARVAT